MPGKSYNYQNFVKDASNSASFYGSQINGVVCVKQIGLGLARQDIKELLKFHKNELKL